MPAHNYRQPSSIAEESSGAEEDSAEGFRGCAGPKAETTEGGFETTHRPGVFVTPKSSPLKANKDLMKSLQKKKRDEAVSISRSKNVTSHASGSKEMAQMFESAKLFGTPLP